MLLSEDSVWYSRVTTAFTTGGGSVFGLAIVRTAADVHGWSHTLTESATDGARSEFRNATFADDRSTGVSLVTRHGS